MTEGNRLESDQISYFGEPIELIASLINSTEIKNKGGFMVFAENSPQILMIEGLENDYLYTVELKPNSYINISFFNSHGSAKFGGGGTHSICIYTENG